MKLILTFFFISNTVVSFAQISSKLDQIINRWTQGEINPNGNVIQADMTMGGSYQLNINKDSTVVFRNPSDCGFGYERHGTWKSNAKEATLVFTFFERKGYKNHPDLVDIDETEIYSLIKLTSNELILTLVKDGKVTTLPFLKTKE